MSEHIKFHLPDGRTTKQVLDRVPNVGEQIVIGDGDILFDVLNVRTFLRERIYFDVFLGIRSTTFREDLDER